MSASSTPTRNPFSLRASARLTATVDLPTPPLPEATAMILATPGTPPGRWRASRAAPARVNGEPCGASAPLPLPSRAAPGKRSAVSVTVTASTPGTDETAFSAATRNASSSRAHICDAVLLARNTQGVPPRAGSRFDLDGEIDLALVDHDLGDEALGDN